METTLNSTDSMHSAAPAVFSRRVAAGVIGGAAGGLVFGMMMAMMGMLPMLAAMVGSDSPIIGFLIHMMISMAFGVGLTVVTGSKLLTSYPRGVIIGVAYGAMWWVLGPLLIMPLMLGGALFVVNTGALLSLMGHLIYGAILGLVAVRVLGSRR